MKVRLAIVPAVCAVLVFAACGGESPDSGGAESQDAGPARFVVQNYTFPKVTVKVGEPVEIVNRDDENHTVTANDGTFDSGPVAKGTPGSVTAPKTAGSYPIHCKIHPTITGTLVVA